MLETLHEDVDTSISSHDSISEYHPATSSPQDAPEDLSDLEQYFDQVRSRDISEDLQKLYQLIDTTEFKDHPTLDGIQTLSLSIEDLPQELKDFIENEQCDIISFDAVKTINGVPLHQHKDDGPGDIYFGWSGNVLVTVVDENNIETVTPLWNNFVVCYPGESHAVQQTPDTEEIFFSVKFTPKQ